MRIAIFQSKVDGEIVLLQVKGSKKTPEAIDGLYSYFGPDSRDLSEYTITLAHVGSGDGVVIRPRSHIDIDGRDEEIEDWFPHNEFEEPCLLG